MADIPKEVTDSPIYRLGYATVVIRHLVESLNNHRGQLNYMEDKDLERAEQFLARELGIFCNICDHRTIETASIKVDDACPQCQQGWMVPCQKLSR